MKGKISVLLRVIISVGLVGFLLWTIRENYPRIAETLVKTNLYLFSAAVILFMLNTVLLSVRLKLLLAGEELGIAFGRVVELSFIGYFFNNFMPTAVGGDIVKAYYVHKQTKENAKSFISVFMDRFIGLFSFILIALFALFLSWENIDLVVKKIVLIFAVFGVLGALVMLNPRIAAFILNLLSKLKLWNIGEHISKAYRAVHEYRNKKLLILNIIGISIVAQSIYFVLIYMLAKALGTDVPVKTVFLIMPIVSVVSMLPSLGGLGLREGAIVALFGPAIGIGSAFSLSILLLATLLCVSLVGGIIYVSASQFKIKRGELSKIDTYRV